MKIQGETPKNSEVSSKVMDIGNIEDSISASCATDTVQDTSLGTPENVADYCTANDTVGGRCSSLNSCFNPSSSPLVDSFTLPSSSRLNPIIGGYLDKLSPTAFKGFQKRYFRLNVVDSALLYWREEPTYNDQQPQGCINLSSVKSIHIEDALHFVIRTQGRDYCLRALAPGDKDIWLESICTIVNVVAHREALKEAKAQYDFSRLLLDNSSSLQTSLVEAFKTQRKIKWVKEDRVPLTFSVRGKKLFLHVKNIQKPLSQLWFDYVFRIRYTNKAYETISKPIQRSSSFCLSSSSLSLDEILSSQKESRQAYFYGTYRGQQIRLRTEKMYNNFGSNNNKNVSNNNNVNGDTTLSNNLTSPIPEYFQSIDLKALNFLRARTYLDNVLFGALYIEVGPIPVESMNNTDNCNNGLSGCSSVPLVPMQKYFALLISSRPIANNEAFFPLPNNFIIQPGNKLADETINNVQIGSEELPFGMQLNCLYLFSPEYDDNPPLYVIELDNIQLSSKIREIQSGFQFRLQVPLQNILTFLPARQELHFGSINANTECVGSLTPADNLNNEVVLPNELESNDGSHSSSIIVNHMNNNKSSNLNTPVIFTTKLSPPIATGASHQAILPISSICNLTSNLPTSATSNITTNNPSILNQSNEKISIRIISIFGPDAEIWRESLVASCRARHAIREQRMRTLYDELRAYDSIPKEILEQNIEQLLYRTMLYIYDNTSTLDKEMGFKRVSSFIGILNDNFIRNADNISLMKLTNLVASSFATIPIAKVLQGLDVFNTTSIDLLQASHRSLGTPRVDILRFIREKYLLPIFEMLYKCYKERYEIFSELDILLILEFLADMQFSYESYGIFDSLFQYYIISFSDIYIRKIIKQYYCTLFHIIDDTCSLGKTNRDKDTGTLSISLFSDLFSILICMANSFSTLQMYHNSSYIRNMVFSIIQQTLLLYQLAMRDVVLLNICTLTEFDISNRDFLFFNEINMQNTSNTDKLNLSSTTCTLNELDFDNYPCFNFYIQDYLNIETRSSNFKANCEGIGITTEVLCGLLNGIEDYIHRCDELDQILERWMPFLLYKYEYEYMREYNLQSSHIVANYSYTQSIDNESIVNNNQNNSVSSVTNSGINNAILNNSIGTNDIYRNLDLIIPRNLRNEAKRFTLLHSLSKILLTIRVCKDWNNKFQNIFISAIQQKQETLLNSNISDSTINKDDNLCNSSTQSNLSWLSLILSFDMDNLLKEAVRPQLRVLKMSLKKSIFSRVSKMILEYTIHRYIKLIMYFAYYYSSIDNKNPSIETGSSIPQDDDTTENNSCDLIASKILEDWDIFGRFFQDCMLEEDIRECLIILADLHDILIAPLPTVNQKCVEFQEKYRIFDVNIFMRSVMRMRCEPNIELFRHSYSVSSIDLDNSLNNSISTDEVTQLLNVNAINNDGNVATSSEVVDTMVNYDKFSSISWSKLNPCICNKQMNSLRNIGNSIIQNVSTVCNISENADQSTNLCANITTNSGLLVGNTNVNSTAVSNILTSLNFPKKKLININPEERSIYYLTNPLNNNTNGGHLYQLNLGTLKRSFSMEYPSIVNSDDNRERNAITSFLLGKLSTSSPSSIILLQQFASSLTQFPILAALMEKDDLWWKYVSNIYSQIFIPKDLFSIPPKSVEYMLSNNAGISMNNTTNNNDLLQCPLLQFKNDIDICNLLSNSMCGKYIMDKLYFLYPPTTEACALYHILGHENEKGDDTGMSIRHQNSTQLAGSLMLYYSEDNSHPSTENVDISWLPCYAFVEDMTLYIYDNTYRFKLYEILNIRPLPCGRVTSVCIDPQDLSRTSFIIFWGDRESTVSATSSLSSPLPSGSCLTQQSSNISTSNPSNFLNGNECYMEAKNLSIYFRAPTPHLASMWVFEIDSLIQKSKSIWDMNFIEKQEKKRACQFLRKPSSIMLHR
ncbi:PH domain-containing protein [Cryptosporidium andersoni]|uniref:PH domain-containing protein n=1 Tax=Cryptosporidium andersoni TaxID=117008 RepID=A0A1J4MRZ2_9CRYT|nr:PH domain-containing protein [Cryptosporidium andersoni]